MRLSGCGLLPALILGLKASAAVCWTSSISGGLFDTFSALDSDDPLKKARAPIFARWAVIDRFELKTRKRLIWICLAVVHRRNRRHLLLRSRRPFAVRGKAANISCLL